MCNQFFYFLTVYGRRLADRLLSSVVPTFAAGSPTIFAILNRIPLGEVISPDRRDSGLSRKEGEPIRESIYKSFVLTKFVDH